MKIWCPALTTSILHCKIILYRILIVIIKFFRHSDNHNQFSNFYQIISVLDRSLSINQIRSNILKNITVNALTATLRPGVAVTVAVAIAVAIACVCVCERACCTRTFPARVRAESTKLISRRTEATHKRVLGMPQCQDSPLAHTK